MGARCGVMFTSVGSSRNFEKLRHVCPSVRLERLGFHRMDLMKFDIWSIFRKYVENVKFNLSHE